MLDSSNLMNVLIVNSDFKLQVQEIADYISKVYQTRDVLNNEVLPMEKKLLFFASILHDIAILQEKHNLKNEGIFGFFNAFLSDVNEDSLKDHLQTMLIDKLLMHPIASRKVGCC